MSSIEITIDHVPNAPTPSILIGFHANNFSQAVVLTVDSDPLACVEMANNIHEQFVAACGRAVSAHKQSSKPSAKGPKR